MSKLEEMCATKSDSFWDSPKDCNKTEDPVNHPSHYTKGDIECIDAIKASMEEREFIGYLKGNALKYLWRYEDKGGVRDLFKCLWYLNKLISQFK